MIDASSARLLATIAARASDALNAYTPGAQPHFPDVVASTPSTYHVQDGLSVTSCDGYFVVDDRGRRAFTKDGGFSVRDGALLSKSGTAVYGYVNAEARKRGVLTALRVDVVDAALGRHDDIRIEADGNVVYTRAVRDAASGAARPERVVLGTLALARFAAGTRPLEIDATHVAAPAGSRVQIGAPADGDFAPLATHSADRGNYDIDRALQRLHDAYESFGALQAARSARGKTDRIAMDLIK